MSFDWIEDLRWRKSNSQFGRQLDLLRNRRTFWVSAKHIQFKSYFKRRQSSAVAATKDRWYRWLLSEPLSRQFAGQNVHEKQFRGLDDLLLQNPKKANGRSFWKIENLENLGGKNGTDKFK